VPKMNDTDYIINPIIVNQTLSKLFLLIQGKGLFYAHY